MISVEGHILEVTLIIHSMDMNTTKLAHVYLDLSPNDMCSNSEHPCFSFTFQVVFRTAPD